MKLVKVTRVDEDNHEIGSIYLNADKLVSVITGGLYYTVQMDLKYNGIIRITRESFQEAFGNEIKQ